MFWLARGTEFSSPIFPPGLIDETLRTLALLLPMHDRDSRKWFQKHHTKLRLDPSAIACGQLKLEERQITHFKYWHDRIIVLKQFFDESQPRTIKQWWFDDRKRVQWFARCFLELYNVLRGGGRFIRRIIRVNWRAYWSSLLTIYFLVEIPLFLKKINYLVISRTANLSFRREW